MTIKDLKDILNRFDENMPLHITDDCFDKPLYRTKLVALHHWMGSLGVMKKDGDVKVTPKNNMQPILCIQINNFRKEEAYGFLMERSREKLDKG